MPPRVNLTILLGFVVAIVLSFGLSASAQPDEGAQGDGAGGVEPGGDSAGVVPEDDKIGEARRELEQLQWEVQTVHGARLNADEEKRQAADDIAGTQNELAAAKERSAEAGSDLADTASEVYRNRGLDDILGVLVGAGTLGDFADRLDLAARLLVQKQSAVEEANEAEEELTSELQERQEHLQRWEATGAEKDAVEERVRQAESDVQAYLDSLDEEVREGIEAERAQQAELDQARGVEILERLEEEEAPAQDLPAAPPATEKLDELRNVERGVEEKAVEKVVEAEQARLAAEQEAAEKVEAPKAVEPEVGGPAALRIERVGLAPELADKEAGQAVTEAEQAATEAAKQAQAAEQARRVAERDAAANLAKSQAAAKKAEERRAELPIEVSNDTDGAVNGGDRLLVQGDFSIEPGSTVTFRDPDGTTGMAIDGLNANIVKGSIDTTMTGPLENVTGGDGVLDATGGLEVVDTTGIVDAGLAIELLGQDATGMAGLQYDPTIGMAGLQYDPIIGATGLQYAPTTGATGLQYAPTTGTAGLQYDPTTGATGLQYGLAIGPTGLKSDITETTGLKPPPIVGDTGLKPDPAAGSAGLQPKPPAVSGQPGLQPKASVPATGAKGGAGGSGLASGSGIVREAMSWLGTPYSYGGTSRSGISCSGLVMMAYQTFGISLPNSPEGQLGVVAPLKTGPAPAGAIVFFTEDGSGSPTHVGISNGDGTMTDANIVKGQVGITPIDIVTGYMGWGFPPGI